MELAPTTQILNAKALQAQRDTKRKKEEELQADAKKKKMNKKSTLMLFKYQKMFDLDACLKSCKQVDDAMKNVTTKTCKYKALNGYGRV